MSILTFEAAGRSHRMLAFSAVLAFVFAVLVLSGQIAWLPALASAGALIVVAAILLRSGGGDAAGETAMAVQAAATSARGEDVQASWDSNPIVQVLPEPILMVDRSLTMVQANQAANSLLNQDLIGRSLETVLREPELLQAVKNVFAEGGKQELSLTLPGKIKRYFRVQVAALHLEQHDEPFVLIALEDLTEIKQSERMRGDFVANVNHELRTPLASISGFIETLRGPAREDVKAREQFLEIMQEQAARMARLVEDLLSLSKIEVKEHSAPTDRVQLAEIAHAVVQELQPQAEAKDMRIETSLNDLPAVIGDRDELTQVVQNLVDNAIKYGRANSTVRITGEPAAPDLHDSVLSSNGAVDLKVSNQGDGIPSDLIPRVTERFFRVDTARSRELGGTGLGLAIVKHIVNRHRGLLRIESEPGAETSVTCVLPRAE